MKRLICWDTSTRTGLISAAQWQEGAVRPELVAEFTLNVDASEHSEQLLWGINQVLCAAGWDLQDLSVLGVGEGPGSFTGVRIGVATAKTLASVLGIKIVPFSSLAFRARSALEFAPLAMACNEVSTRGSKKKSKAASKGRLWEKSIGNFAILVVEEAAKGEWFVHYGDCQEIRRCVVMHHGDLPGLWSAKVREGLVRPEEFISEFKEFLGTKRPWLVIREPRDRFFEFWSELDTREELVAGFGNCSVGIPRVAAQMVWEAYQAGVISDPKGLSPRYLRESDAERNLKLKLGVGRR